MMLPPARIPRMWPARSRPASRGFAQQQNRPRAWGKERLRARTHDRRIVAIIAHKPRSLHRTMVRGRRTALAFAPSLPLPTRRRSAATPCRHGRLQHHGGAIHGCRLRAAATMAERRYRCLRQPLRQARAVLGWSARSDHLGEQGTACRVLIGWRATSGARHRARTCLSAQSGVHSSVYPVLASRSQLHGHGIQSWARSAVERRRTHTPSLGMAVM